MPQIDIVTFFPIILGVSLSFFFLYLILNIHFFLPFVNFFKIDVKKSQKVFLKNKKAINSYYLASLSIFGTLNKDF